MRYQVNQEDCIDDDGVKDPLVAVLVIISVRHNYHEQDKLTYRKNVTTKESHSIPCLLQQNQTFNSPFWLIADKETRLVCK